MKAPTVHDRVFEWLKRSGVQQCSDVALALNISAASASDALRRLNMFGLLARHGNRRSAAWSVLPDAKNPGDRRSLRDNTGMSYQRRVEMPPRVLKPELPTLPPPEWSDGRLEAHWGIGVSTVFILLAINVHDALCSEAPGLCTPIEIVLGGESISI